MRLVFLGPPGAGKGTMARRLAKQFAISHISTGEIFRSNIQSGTSLGYEVAELIRSGKFVPDKTTIELVRVRLAEPDVASGYILDGFPRTIAQAEALETISQPDTVVNLVVDDATTVRRLAGRRVHPASGRTYHLEFNPPRSSGKDDVTGEVLVQRPDDREEVIRERLSQYRAQTAPLVAYYRDLGRLVDLDGSPQPDTVFETLCDVVRARWG